jgi:hypothetical protein
MMKQYKKLFLLSCMIFSIPIFAKRVAKQNGYLSIETFVRNNSWFKIVPLHEILQKNSHIKYQKCFGPVNFEFSPFPLSSLVPHKGCFKECFILEVPQGSVQGHQGFVFFNELLPQEMVWADQYYQYQNIPKIEQQNIQHVSGTVAVIAQPGSSNYCHFFNEILARLAMLEMHGMEYDWLYVTRDAQFVKDALRLWGVDESKIISPTDKNFSIQADTLIVPSLVLNTNNGFRHTGVNAHPYTLRYVREKLLSSVVGKIDNSQFCRRVFISRRDAPSRRITNEDKIFELFKTKGFERYDTGKMSAQEQIALFAQAEVVVGEHGAGMANILFCKEGTRVIELFQSLIDTSFWFPAQIFNLNYTPINTLRINPNYFINWAENNPNIYFKAMISKVDVPLGEIYKILESL